MLALGFEKMERGSLSAKVFSYMLYCYCGGGGQKQVLFLVVAVAAWLSLLRRENINWCLCSSTAPVKLRDTDYCGYNAPMK